MQGEVRLGMENCCQASGTAEIYKAVMEAKEELGINVRIKPVSCVGACNQVPLIDLALPDGTIKRYPNINSEDVREILLHHFEPKSRLLRLRNKLFRHIDHFQTDEIWDSSVWTADEHRTRTINNFFAGQRRISTEGYGLMSPLDIEEYLHRDGFKALRKALTEMSREQIIDEILNSGLRGRGGGGFTS